MKFWAVIKLLLHVLYGSIVTGFIIAKECFFSIFSRKQKSVKDEVIVVTGAGHGLGRRVAINLSRLGATVICWDKNTDSNTNTVWDIRHEGGKAHGYTCDVRDRAAVMAAADRVVKDVGPVTMLINNAGIYPVKKVIDFTPEELKDIFDTNVMAHFWTLKAFLPGMLERNSGHIVAISSAASILPVAHEVPYSASKSAVTGLMDGLIQELRFNPKNKVKITIVHPYYTAVRDDIPVKFDLRIERMSPDYVAAQIVKGMRQERESITIPGFMHFWINFVRCLPQTARKMWREDIFYTRVHPTDEVEVTMETTSVEEKFRCAEKLTGTDFVGPVMSSVQEVQISVPSAGNSYRIHMPPSTEINNKVNAGFTNDDGLVETPDADVDRIMHAASAPGEDDTAGTHNGRNDMTQI